jgi:hypothetical protein
MSSSWRLALGLAIGVCGVVAACSGEVADPHYGPPSGLTGKSPPTGDPGDGGTTTPPAQDANAPANALCNGQGPIDGGACTVQWKRDIFPQMTGGNWKCSDANCHGSKAAVAPFIDGNDAHAAYVSLMAYTKINAKPYINPCSVDPAASTFLCNLDPKGTVCGAAVMPLTSNPPGGKLLTTTETDQVKKWIACGSPEN